MRVLGDLTVDGTDLARLDRKARSLLQLLALARGRPVPADALVDALWGDVPPARPGDQLAVLASRLRRELGRDRIERSDGGYRVVADWLDLSELDAVVAEAERRHAAGEIAGAVSAARIGQALVRGPLPEPRTEAPWAIADHAAAVRLVRRARQVAAAAFLDAGLCLDALDLAAADAFADPLDEQAVRTVMRAQAATGRPGLALAAYAALRETLADQLGTDPSTETDTLNTAILRGEVAVRAAGPAPTVLIGRTSQAGHLDALAGRAIDDRSARVAKVVGDAGIGKTTLLDAWSAARRAGGDLVLAGTCRPLDRAAPLDVVLTAIADHLRGSPEADTLLGPELGTLAPLLGLTTAAVSEPRGVDPALGPATLFAAVTAVLGRIAGSAGAILVIDDAHLAGQAFADWLRYVLRRPMPVLVVVGARPAEGPDLPATDEIGLGPLDRAQVAELVGSERADDLYDRSGGHPLFLSELAAVPAGELPPSLVAAVSTRCDQLGTAGDLVRAAAVLGDLDVEMLAAVLNRRALHVLADVELAEQRGLLVEDAGRHRFRHELAREALVTGTTAGRRALLHREAGRALAGRPDADPAAVADHARLGGDRALAATWLRIAAARAAERFDHATAEDLLDESLRAGPGPRHPRRPRAGADPARQLPRRRGRHRGRDRRGRPAVGGGRLGGLLRPAFRRRAPVRRRRCPRCRRRRDPHRCLVASGRVLHARGDLDAAHDRLSEAMGSATGEERLEAAAWLGVVHAHRSRAAEAIELLRPLTRSGVGADHTTAFMHALLFSGHALAVEGRPAEALACFDRYGAEVERRDVPRFAGRGVNFSGWVLRNLGATGEGLERHHAALDDTAASGRAELLVAASEDLAEDRIRAADPEEAAALLDRARSAMHGDLVFGWRLRMKLQLLDAQVRLLAGSPEEALRIAEELREDAVRAGVPRYDASARLVAHRARAALGEPVDLDQAWRDLDDVGRAVRVEAWWWAGQTGAELGQPRWLDRAERLADDLARAAGPHADGLRVDAERHLVRWRATTGSP